MYLGILDNNCWCLKCMASSLGCQDRAQVPYARLLKAPSQSGMRVSMCNLRSKTRVFCRCNLHFSYVIFRIQPGRKGHGGKMSMPNFLHVFSTSDITYYRTYLSARKTSSMPTVHASFQTPKNVGNIEVVENVRVDVTES